MAPVGKKQECGSSDHTPVEKKNLFDDFRVKNFYISDVTDFVECISIFPYNKFP